jgi:hypothetical protein
MTARSLLASFVLTATLATGVLLGAASPAAAEETTGTPAYGETVALDGADLLKVGASAVVAVVGVGLIGYALLPARRARRAVARPERGR